MDIEVLYLTVNNGKTPFLEWEKKLDLSARAAVRTRIGRVRVGNFGDCHPIKGVTGLHELKIQLGPGYRIYFGKMKDTVVIILCGGDKGSQERDINRAAILWHSYKDSLKKRGNHG